MKYTSMRVKRHPNNPFLGPDSDHQWESEAVFNPCVVVREGKKQVFYRALSETKPQNGVEMKVSTIGFVEGSEESCLSERRLLLEPQEPWDAFGCEDPRVTFIEGTYYIFYTALSNYPHTPEGIKIGVAVSKDLKHFERHLVTPFNAKAMALFPEKINGKYVAVLSVDTDRPPSKIAIAEFDHIEDMWSHAFWEKWYDNIGEHLVDLQRKFRDHIEVGAAPIKTKDGWLLVHSYIYDYKTGKPNFTIEAALLDGKNPRHIIGRTPTPILYPEKMYELNGQVPQIVFPSGATVEGERLHIYYGAADTRCCEASLQLDELLEQLAQHPPRIRCKRFEENPILSPVAEHPWETKYTLNPGAIRIEGNTHIIYRAMGDDDTSVLGYARASDNVHIDERLHDPIYVPRKNFEIKKKEGFSGCEDARLTLIGDRIYMCYTAFNAQDTAGVAFTSIAKDDFLEKRWFWEDPKLISPEGRFDKNACLLSEKVNGKFTFLHRLDDCIWADYRDNLDISQEHNPLGGEILMDVRPDSWDSLKIGIAGPPHALDKEGKRWLLLYHGVSKYDSQYRIGAAIMEIQPEGDLDVTHRLPYPILEPEEEYEHNGYRPGTVFVCGSVEDNEKIYLYYGAADQYCAGAFVSKQKLLKGLEEYPAQ